MCGGCPLTIRSSWQLADTQDPRGGPRAFSAGVSLVATDILAARLLPGPCMHGDGSLLFIRPLPISATDALTEIAYRVDPAVDQPDGTEKCERLDAVEDEVLEDEGSAIFHFPKDPATLVGGNNRRSKDQEGNGGQAPPPLKRWHPSKERSQQEKRPFKDQSAQTKVGRPPW